MIEDLLFHPSVRAFVFAHPFITWGLLAAVLSSLMLVPIMWTWPKAKKPK
jgi:hypothetical protein